MTKVNLFAVGLVIVGSSVPAMAQISLRPGQPMGTAGGKTLTATPAGTMSVVTPQQVAAMPKKMVNGQQLVQSNGRWYSLVASGAGNYQLVASGAGN